MAGGRRSQTSPSPAPARVAVLGGGADGALVAALSVIAGIDTVMFSAYGQELAALRGGGLTLRGEGPIGTVPVDPASGPGIHTTAELDAALAGADVIVLTGPLHKQRTYAMVLADHVSDGQTLVVPNAGTFGALETASLLRGGGCTAAVKVVELSGLPFWIDGEVPRLTLSSRQALQAASLSSGTLNNAALTPVFGELSESVSVAQTAFSDASAAIELPALLLGGPVAAGGGPAVPDGAVARAEHSNFHSLLGHAQLTVARALYQERCAVASRYGVRDLASFDEALLCCAGAPQQGAEPSAGRRAVPSQMAASFRIRDLVQGSLQPLVSAAKGAGVPVPNSVAMVQLASTVLGDDLSRNGRTLAQLGVSGTDPDSVRRSFEQLTKGAA